MILKLLLKIWPAIAPIFIYFLWIVAKKLARKFAMKAAFKAANKIIDGEFYEVKKDSKAKKVEEQEEQEEKVGDFSLANRHFVAVLYLSLVAAIFCFLFFALRVPKIQNGHYVPPHIENGKVIPGKIIEIVD